MNDNKFIDLEEITEITISVLALSVAVTLAYNGLGIFSDLKAFFIMFILFLTTVGTGFIIHEMAHKVSAMHFGAYARFKMWVNGLLLMLATSFFGFIFAAPGAVYIYSNTITKRENGLVSLAGPAVNIAISLFFIGFNVFFPTTVSGITVWILGARINAFLALFNMIPFPPLDGSKVMAWNWIVWLLFTILAAGIFFMLGGLS